MVSCLQILFQNFFYILMLLLILIYYFNDYIFKEKKQIVFDHKSGLLYTLNITKYGNSWNIVFNKNQKKKRRNNLQGPLRYYYILLRIYILCVFANIITKFILLLLQFLSRYFSIFLFRFAWFLQIFFMMFCKLNIKKSAFSEIQSKHMMLKIKIIYRKE